MNGSRKLSKAEKQEMLKDVKNAARSRAFHAARRLSEQGTLDEYIEFLSENISSFNIVPTQRITKNFRL